MNRRQPALIFIMITVLLDVIGIGLIIPILPDLIKHLAGSSVIGVQWAGILAASYAAMQFLFSPVLGSLSDRYGRRPVLLLSLAGMTLDYVLLFFAPSLSWLLVGRIIAGITGASVTVTSAYIADVSSNEDRAKNFGMLGGAFGLGFIIGPALGGLLGSYDLHLPFLVAAGMSFLNMVYGVFVLPESLPAGSRQAHGWRMINPLSPLRKLLNNAVLRNLASAIMLTGLAAQVIFNIFVFFTGDVLGWAPMQNGMALAFVGILAIVVQVGLLGRMIPILGERNTILLGIFASMLQFVLFGFSRSTPLMYVGLLIGALGGLAPPAIQAVISRQVNEYEQGQVQGAIAGLNSLVGLIGPLLATRVYAFGTDLGQPGLAFFMGAGLTLLSMLMIVYVFTRILPAMQERQIESPDPSVQIL